MSTSLSTGGGGALRGLGLTLAALGVIAWLLWLELSPLFADLSLSGAYDWDVQSVFRALTVLSLRDFGELPLWHPWYSGGYTAWGYVEGATNLLSPFAPLYFAFSFPWALRLEIVGSTLLGCAGAFALAGRFTTAPVLRALVVVLGMLNGRWTMQIGAGHAWHLQYAWLPWALFFFQRAIERPEDRDSLYAGVALAMMVYMGGIYPLPHAALLVTLYALIVALARRSRLPLLVLMRTGLIALGLAALKLVPIALAMSRSPRKIKSYETIDLWTALRLFTDRDQGLASVGVTVPSWGFFEYGIYVGWAGVVVLGCGLVAWSRRAPLDEQAVRGLAVLFLLLGLGDFRPGPWHILHQAPVFSSQHVPSRFLFVAALLASVAAVAWLSRRFAESVQRWQWLALLPLFLLATDIGHIAARASHETFVRVLPPLARLPRFSHHTFPLAPYTNEPETFARYPSMLANVDVVDLNNLPELVEPGVIPEDNPAYTGEVSVAEGSGTAKLEAWSPNSAAMSVHGASGGARVVYNVNFDAGWRCVEGECVVEAFSRRVSFVLPHAGDQRVVLRYRPRGMWLGVALFALTVLALFAGPRFRRARRTISP